LAARKIEMGKTPEELYWEREKRVLDVIQLKVPDRVPVSTGFGYFPAKYAGVTVKDAFYDYQRWRQAYRKTVLDFEPDIFRLIGNDSGEVLESLNHKQMMWPGHGVSPNHSHQFVEGEYMKADEYDLFLKDPSDFLVRCYLPRVYGALAPFEKLPPLHTLLTGLPFKNLAMPEFARLFEALVKTAHESLAWRAETGTFAKEMRDLGFPCYGMSGGSAPFDVISDRLRGMRGTMLDMYRNPDKLLEACEMLLPWQSERLSSAAASGESIVFIALHRGAEGFMSLKQFETFYWPTLKEHAFNVVNAGLIPCIFFEGDYTSRLEYLLELPRGKVLGHFDSSDIIRVKEVLGNHMCIMGNVPPSLLQTGSPQEVKDYCKRLIDVVGKGGGFIMSPRSAIDEVKPENLKTMFDFTKEYGRYN
jgi:hypothetical protein